MKPIFWRKTFHILLGQVHEANIQACAYIILVNRIVTTPYRLHEYFHRALGIVGNTHGQPLQSTMYATQNRFMARTFMIHQGLPTWLVY